MLFFAMEPLDHLLVAEKVKIRPFAGYDVVSGSREGYFFVEFACEGLGKRLAGIDAALRELPGPRPIQSLTDENLPRRVAQDCGNI